MVKCHLLMLFDIFMEKLHNRGIKSKLDAWLTFLGCDEPEYIIRLIAEYPEFKAMYSHLYDMCLNIEGVMDMFSKELQILDRNTVKYMIDEYQEELDNTKLELNDAKARLNDAKARLNDVNAELDKTNAELDKTNAELDKTNAELDKTNAELNKTNAQLDEANTKLSDATFAIAEKDALIAKLQAELDKKK